ncbi:HSP20 family molecular chaperone IbpA [Anoxybacillus calidus]|jgi:HSP20 family molecular chaperone IbpA|uniref:HSP20 family molecular chaperone IbpA n=1 Tax=[Anoxybacillus] calidus TaxID=575178 RepID=A0A7V9Z2S9_9BACL|nr:Hsp20/alpha crystallin family protein [Anoxybacillus calidus]MBA2872865.1 HSP20 family molecular chaperone IbpA [Anoxybacillus calidus]
MFPFQSFFPFKEGIQKWLQQSHAMEIEKYVQDSIAKSIPNSMQMYEHHAEILKKLFGNSEHTNSHTSDNSTVAPKLDVNIFESLDHIYLKMPIKDSSQLSQLKIFHTSNQAIIEGIPSPEDRHVIPLPSIVKKKGASTNYKDGILQIKIPKRIDFQYTEIDVPNID